MAKTSSKVHRINILQIRKLINRVNNSFVIYFVICLKKLNTSFYLQHTTSFKNNDFVTKYLGGDKNDKIIK